MSAASKVSQDPMAVQRGNYAYSLPAPLLLASFRFLTVPVQYLILTRSTSLTFPLKPLSTSQAIILAMPGLLALKHTTWLLFYMRERMTLPFAFFGGIADILFEATTSYVFTLNTINPTYSPHFLLPGLALNILGITTELVSELQRARFKSLPENEGKIYTGGLWGYVRNLNYACNVVFSFGYALAAGGPVYGAFYSGIYVMNFVFNAIPGLERYMREKYGSQWGAVEGKVRWRLCPGIY